MLINFPAYSIQNSGFRHPRSICSPPEHALAVANDTLKLPGHTATTMRKSS
jgi:hypothetical protein